MDAKSLIVAANPENVDEEARFETLNRSGFVRGETAEYQWYLAVTGACSVSGVSLDEAVKAYLSTMLWRFMGRAELFEQLAAFDFYQHVLKVASIDSLCLQDVADICVQYVAFFPERSYNRHEPRSLEHIAGIGVSAYEELAESSGEKDDCASCAYRLMATSFGLSVMVLRTLCPRFAQDQEISRAKAAEKLWKEAVRFPSVSEAMRLAPMIRDFSHMYFQFEDTGGSEGILSNLDRLQ